MKDKIVKLRLEGKSYKEIKDLLGCSLGTISYHCGKGQKEKSRRRQIKNRTTRKIILTKKLNKFKSRGLSMKLRDFQRERNTSGSWEGVGKFSKSFEVEEVLKDIVDKPMCYLTGMDINLEDPSTYSFDHIEPVSRGGTSELSNLGLCTRNANMSKHKLMLDEYIDLCKRVLIHNGYKVQ